jgi:hypothetical protein
MLPRARAIALAASPFVCLGPDAQGDSQDSYLACGKASSEMWPASAYSFAKGGSTAHANRLRRADACPVKDKVYRVGRRYAMRVIIVANGMLRVPSRWPSADGGAFWIRSGRRLIAEHDASRRSAEVLRILGVVGSVLSNSRSIVGARMAMGSSPVSAASALLALGILLLPSLRARQRGLRHGAAGRSWAGSNRAS